jgi:Ras-related protein Rab-11A
LLIKLLQEKTKEIEQLKLEYDLLNQQLSELKPSYKMEENLGNKEQILNVLKSGHLTSSEIAKKLSLSKQDTRTYIQRLKAEDKIKVIGKKGRSLVYTSKKPISIAEEQTKPDSLVYDLRFLLNLIEKKITPKDGVNLNPDDLMNIEKIKKRIVDKKWDDKQGINALNEFLDFENTYKEEINEKLAQLEAKVNYIISGIEQDTIEEEEDKASISETTSISTRKSDIIFQGRTEAIYKVIVIGDAAVGKRSLLTKFAKNQFEEKYLPTVGVNILKEPINIDENTIVNLMFWVIQGQPQFYMLHRPYFNGADGVILIYDVTRSSTFSNVNNWWNSAVKYGLSDVPRILIGNKIDLKDERKIILPMAEHLSEKINAPYFETSAITGENVELVFQNIAKMVYNSLDDKKRETELKKVDESYQEELLRELFSFMKKKAQSAYIDQQNLLNQRKGYRRAYLKDALTMIKNNDLISAIKEYESSIDNLIRIKQYNLASVSLAMVSLILLNENRGSEINQYLRNFKSKFSSFSTLISEIFAFSLVEYLVNIIPFEDAIRLNDTVNLMESLPLFEEEMQFLYTYLGKTFKKEKSMETIVQKSLELDKLKAELEQYASEISKEKKDIARRKLMKNQYWRLSLEDLALGKLEDAYLDYFETIPKLIEKFEKEAAVSLIIGTAILMNYQNSLVGKKKFFEILTKLERIKSNIEKLPEIKLMKELFFLVKNDLNDLFEYALDLLIEKLVLFEPEIALLNKLRPKESKEIDEEKNLKTKKRKRENLRKRQQPYTHSSDYDDLFKTIIVGDGGVGKTALASQFSKGFITEDYKNVIGVDFHTKNISIDTLSGTKKYKLQIWDTGGQERFSSIRPMYYRGSLGALLIFDLTNHSTFEHLPQWIDNIRTNTKTKIPILLVGNKSDLVDIRSVSIKEINQFTKDFNLYYMETSAKTGEGVEDCFYILTCLMIGQGVPEHLIANNTIFPPGEVNLSLSIIRSKPIVASEPQFEFEAPEIELGSPKIMINDNSSFGFIAPYASSISSPIEKKKLEKDKKIKDLKKKNKKNKEKIIQTKVSESPSFFKTLLAEVTNSFEEPPFVESKYIKSDTRSELKVIPNIEDIEERKLLICNKCGATMSSDYAFCNKCGAKLLSRKDRKGSLNSKHK